uniref:Bulb-type lectin domain-containing protein n=1 Tax=Salix viminalis TaxID=40686 RepID=A0A6N2KG46_SALVM
MKAHILFGSGLELGKFQHARQLFFFFVLSITSSWKTIPFCQEKSKASTKSESSDLAIFLSAAKHTFTLTIASQVEVPSEYSVELLGRAFLMETNQMEPSFRVAVSVEPVIGKYSCSLQVFLGDVKVWNSGHYSHFYTSDKCALELTKDGDLRLKGSNDRIGWRTGTSGQGVERLEILKTGNLVLVDALNRIKWQSFNFPTDVMLWGQRLNVATRLTSFPTNSTAFYSFEIQHSKIALYLSSGKWNYSYWEVSAYQEQKHHIY